MPRKPGVWFPAPESAADIQLLGPGAILTAAEVACHLRNSEGVELREKVGVTGGRDGSGKVTTRLLRSGDWFFKTDMARAALDPVAFRGELEKLVLTADRKPIWHPEKCWFVLRADPQWWPVSYTPALYTLRDIRDWSKRRAAWAKMIAFGLLVANRFGVGMDLNPSNFGFDRTGSRLFYLDDELYAPLTLREVAEALAARIPEEPAGTHADWEDWGLSLRKIITPVCRDLDDWQQLLDGLRDYPLTPLFYERREALIGGLVRDHPRLDKTARRVVATVEAHPKPQPSQTTTPLPESLRAPSNGLICVLADVHGNYAALRAVLKAAHEAGATGYLFLGDAVGYGPYPSECVAALQQLPSLTALRGNHDHYAASDTPPGDEINRIARESLAWTRPRLRPADRAWLNALPSEYQGRRWLAVHGAPCCPLRFQAYVYEPTYRENLDVIERDGIQVCFYGHTHVPFMYRRSSSGDERLYPSAIKLFRPGETILLNPGSVGQSRDGDPRAAFAMWDQRTDWVTFHRVDYPVNETAIAITAAGLPEDLAYRLDIGR